MVNMRILLEKVISILLPNNEGSMKQKFKIIIFKLYEFVKNKITSNELDQKIFKEIPSSVINFFQNVETEKIKMEFLFMKTINENLHYNPDKKLKTLYLNKKMKSKALMFNDLLKLYNEEFILEFLDVNNN